MKLGNEGRQDRRCGWCGVYENIRAVVVHHIYKRGTRPDLIDDQQNHLDLCSECHDRTERDMAFLATLQQVFYPNPPPYADNEGQKNRHFGAGS